MSAADPPGVRGERPDRYVGRAVRRIEDRALVAGSVPFIGNVSFPGMLHCAILRSPHAHAHIVRMDTRRAQALPGVFAVLSGEDVHRWCNPCITAPTGWGVYCLAVDHVRFVGEPVAAVAATSRFIAEDALELIDVEYEVLQPLATPMAAIAPGAPVLFDGQSDNIILRRLYNWGPVDEEFAAATHIVRGSFRWNRVGANPMETFGCICQWDLAEDSLTCHGAYQTPSFIALGRAAALKLPANRVKVVSYPQGGGFGGKGGPRATDIASLLSRKTGGRPVKYIEDRMEYLLAGGGQSWDRYYEAEIALGADGVVTGFKVSLLDDQGAGAEGYGTISVAKPLAAFTGCYAIKAARYDVKVVATNRAPTYPYRGYGPPPHFLVLESLMDMAARKLEMDPAELRRRNYIRRDQFPYTIPSGNEYDSGDYAAVLDKMLELSDYRALRAEQQQARAAGRLVGIGLVSTIEPGVWDWNAYAMVGVPGVGVPEGARVALDILGNVSVVVGFALQGQGQYTVAAQVAADFWGVELEAVRVSMAATDCAPPHFGPGGSRLGVAVAGAVLGACCKLEATLRRVVAHLMRSDEDAIELVNGRFQLKKMPQSGMTLAEVAGAMLARSDLLPPGMEPYPEATYVWTAPNRTMPDDEGRCRSYLTAANATHLALIEIDRATGRVSVLKYFIVDDCGTRLNPAMVEGQIQGGLAQGIGAALYEQYVYDDRAQPLVTTWVDYLVPTLHEVPIAKKAYIVTPSPFTPFGAKGCGEGAMHATPAAILCAINDALAPLGLALHETPASPQRLWALLNAVQSA